MLYRSPALAGEALARPVVAIGNFDGVHRGHAAVIARVVAEAESRGVDAAVLTFEPHPVRFFRPDVPEFRLTTLTQKAERLAELGVHAVVAATFDADIANLSPTEFVEHVLVAQLGASAVLVGLDFRFGKGRAGDVDELRRLGAARDLEVLTLEQVRIDGEPISSTRIREALGRGDLATVTRLLQRPYTVTGVVEGGDELGRTFGFPTANIAPHNPLLPPDGIYATRLWSEVHGEFVAATYVGTRPAVGGGDRVVEAFCLDAPADLHLYGETVELLFEHRVREDMDFDSHDGLIAQMHDDVARVRELLQR